MVHMNVAEIVEKHATYKLVEGIDRMYLNGYVPSPQLFHQGADGVSNRLGGDVARR